MASNLLQCNSCHEELNLEAKTLPCLHSFCRSCLDRHFQGETNKIGHCPECCELTPTLDQLNLSPFLMKSLRCQKLESSDWKCDLCLEDGIKSTAKNWCHECQKLFCANCNRFHKKLQPKHNARDLDGMERGEVINALMTDMCPLHQKAKDIYCELCNICLCDKCYQNHSTDSPRCSSQRLSVSKETLKQKSQGSNLAEQMSDLETSLSTMNERTMNYCEKLDSACKSKCEQLWQDFEETMKKAREKMEELCEEIRQKTAEQMKRWQHLMEENKKILKQLEIWRINLHHLLSNSQQDVDVVCGLKSLGAKMSSWLNKPLPIEENCQLQITFSNWWTQFLQSLKIQKIGSVSLTVEKLPTLRLQFDKQWKLHGWSSDISSINVSDVDGHVLLCDYNNSSIIEFTERGTFVEELVLLVDGIKFHPKDMCWVTPNQFLVSGALKKLVFLTRNRYTPFLQIIKVINTQIPYCSLCRSNETIIACDLNFQFDSFNKQGEEMKTISKSESWSQFSWPLICTNPSNGCVYGTRIYSSEIFSFSSFQKRSYLKTEEEITDFSISEFGDFYFCNFEGILSISPTKYLCKFEKKSEELPRIFVLRNKIFVSLKIDGQYLIKIFKINK